MNSTKVQHKFSRRPMLNKLMKTLVEKTNNSDIDDKKSFKMSSLQFKYRKIGVNANAHNYAFADDCYSQSVSPAVNSIPSEYLKQQRSVKRGFRPRTSTFSRTSNKKKIELRVELTDPQLLEKDHSDIISINNMQNVASEPKQKE